MEMKLGQHPDGSVFYLDNHCAQSFTLRTVFSDHLPTHNLPLIIATVAGTQP